MDKRHPINRGWRFFVPCPLRLVSEKLSNPATTGNGTRRRFYTIRYTTFEGNHQKRPLYLTTGIRKIPLFYMGLRRFETARKSCWLIFKTDAIDHSATSPCLLVRASLLELAGPGN